MLIGKRRIIVDLAVSSHLEIFFKVIFSMRSMICFSSRLMLRIENDDDDDGDDVFVIFSIELDEMERCRRILFSMMFDVRFEREKQKKKIIRSRNLLTGIASLPSIVDCRGQEKHFFERVLISEKKTANIVRRWNNDSSGECVERDCSSIVHDRKRGRKREREKKNRTGKKRRWTRLDKQINFERMARRQAASPRRRLTEAFNRWIGKFSLTSSGQSIDRFPKTKTIRMMSSREKKKNWCRDWSMLFMSSNGNRSDFNWMFLSDYRKIFSIQLYNCEETCSSQYVWKRSAQRERNRKNREEEEEKEKKNETRQDKSIDGRSFSRGKKHTEAENDSIEFW